MREIGRGFEVNEVHQPTMLASIQELERRHAEKARSIVSLFRS
jgi:hypothetical protein